MLGDLIFRCDAIEAVLSSMENVSDRVEKALKNVPSAYATENRLAIALMGYMLEYVPWYHIKDGELVEGARSDMDALYKASDIRAMIERIGGMQ